jgi:hypothetical protein
MVMMGQVKQGFKKSDTPGRSNISKFENHVLHEWLIPWHPQCVMGPLRLRTRRIEGCTRFELWEATISDFIQCYEEILSLDRFDDSESIRHDWIHHFIRNLCNHLRETATRTEKGDKMNGKGGGGKRKAEGSINECHPKRPNIEVADIHNKLFVVQVHGDATSGSLFRIFQGLEKYSQLLKWIAKAKLKGRFTLQAIYRCQLSEEAAQEATVMVGKVFRGSVWIQKTWNAEVQNFRAVAPEAATLLHEANLWNGDGEDTPENVLLVEEPKKSNDREGVS